MTEYPILLLQQLLRCPSITPQAGGALDVIETHAKNIGFEVTRLVFHDENTPSVENLYASIGSGHPHLMFAGHVDVVPPGDEEAWASPPFAAEIIDDKLYGRGTVDMKGGIAAFLGAVSRYLDEDARRSFSGRLSLLITGDEEGPAINGTVKLLQWAKTQGECWDGALVGEPTNPETLGEMIKIGRRGSLSGILTLTGCQGHVAYPYLAANPLRSLASYLEALHAIPLDEGSEHFQPSNLELTSIDTGNMATNVIPAQVKIRFNIRFNDLWTIETLKQAIDQRLEHLAVGVKQSSDKKHGENKKLEQTSHPGTDNGDRSSQQAITYQLNWLEPASDVFITRDEKLSLQLGQAIKSVTGRDPILSTSGGTSDARFIKDYCPVIEFGLVGQTMHQVNEHVPIAQLEQLTSIYEHFLKLFFNK